MRLDMKDRKILYELDKNARQSFTQLGKRVRLPKETVNYRVKRMIENGVIEYFYATIDPSAIGYKAYRIYIQLQNLTINLEEKMFTWLRECRKSWWVVDIEGKWDLDIVILAQDDCDFRNFWLSFQSQFKLNIKSYNLHIYTSLYHYHKAYLLKLDEDTEAPDIMLKSTPVQLDEADKSILKVLSSNARIPIVSLASQINSNPRTVLSKFKKLEKSVILSYRTKIDLTKIDYLYYKVEFNINDNSIIPQLYRYAHHNPYIAYLNEVIGLADFDFDIEVPSVDALHRVITDIRKKFGSKIIDYSYFQLKKVHQISYYPM